MREVKLDVNQNWRVKKITEVQILGLYLSKEFNKQRSIRLSVLHQSISKYKDKSRDQCNRNLRLINGSMNCIKFFILEIVTSERQSARGRCLLNAITQCSYWKTMGANCEPFSSLHLSIWMYQLIRTHDQKIKK